MIELTRKHLAELLSLTAPRVTQLVEEGVLVRNAKHKYELSQVTAYIEHIRKPEQKKESFQQLLEQQKFREKKRENDIAESLVAPTSVLADALEKTCTAMLPHLEMLPLTMKRRCPELTGDQIQVVKEAVAECRNSMAEAEIVLDDS